MGREVRRVPADWQHPRNAKGNYRPLRDRPYAVDEAEWLAEREKWDRREIGYANPEVYERYTFAEWHGPRPDPEEYMPDWPAEARTHYQMYECTSEGTPISPVMPDPESLAHWLADNNVSAFGSQTASYEAWLRVCRGGFAPSAMYTRTGLVSGVEGLTD